MLEEVIDVLVVIRRTQLYSLSPLLPPGKKADRDCFHFPFPIYQPVNTEAFCSVFRLLSWGHQGPQERTRGFSGFSL